MNSCVSGVDTCESAPKGSELDGASPALGAAGGPNDGHDCNVGGFVDVNIGPQGANIVLIHPIHSKGSSPFSSHSPKYYEIFSSMHATDVDINRKSCE